MNISTVNIKIAKPQTVWSPLTSNPTVMAELNPTNVWSSRPSKPAAPYGEPALPVHTERNECASLRIGDLVVLGARVTSLRNTAPVLAFTARFLLQALSTTTTVRTPFYQVDYSSLHRLR